MTDKQKQLIQACMELAFESGRWQGEADLEQKMDNNFFDSFLMQNNSGLCLHTVALADLSRPVRYFLRSGKWREGVSKSSREHLKDAFDILIENF